MRITRSPAEANMAGKRGGPSLLVAILAAVLLTGGVATGWFAPGLLRTPVPPTVASPALGGPVVASGVSGQYFDHVVIILMENHAICSILTTCGGSGPYETSLAQAYGLATHFVDCSHPSLPNYLCLSGGSDFGCTGYDGLPHSNTCTDVAWNSTNIVDSVVGGGLSWKAYAENMPSNCYGANSGEYYARHFPFVYYKDIVSNSSRAARCVPAGTNDATLLADLNSTATASNYMWLSPNGCNDMHDCSVSTGDTYLKGLVPKILNSTAFLTTRAALFITYDEDSGTSGAPYVYTVWAGPTAKTGYTSSSSYNHFSLLKTIEANWNLPSLTSNDGNAASMGEFFTAVSSSGPTARFTYAPTWPQVNATVTFNASATTDSDPNATLQYRWDWTDDGTFDTPWSSNPVATHGYSAKGVYTVHLQVQDSGGAMANTTYHVTVDSEAPVTTSSLSGTLGNNGWYRSSVSVKLTATDDLSGVKTTKYQKDGGTWTTYSSSVSVSGDGSHTVAYYSVDNAGNVEVTHSVSMKIDTKPPATTATLQGQLVNNSYYVGPVNVTLSASDATSGVAWTKYSLDNGSWTGYTATVAVSGNGTHSFSYYSQDNAGNTETTHTAIIVIGSPPAYPVSWMDLSGTLGNASWYISTVTVTLVYSDPFGSNASVSYRLDGGAWHLYASPFSLADGKHTIQYNATDALGKAEPSHWASVNVDTHAPTTTGSLQGTLSNGTYLGAVNVSLAATDSQSGVARIQYRVDAGPWMTYSGRFQVAGNGTHTLYYNSSDVAGNRESVRTKTFQVGASSVGNAPVTSVELVGRAGSSGWYVSNVSVVINATDPLGASMTLSVRIDGGAWQSYAGPVLLREGRHTVEYVANDSLGYSAADKSVIVDIDLTPPALMLEGPSGTVVTRDVTFTWTASDALSGIAVVGVSLDGGSFRTEAASHNLTLSLPDGPHYLTVKVRDAAGNMAIQVDQFRVDTNPISPDGPNGRLLILGILATTPVVVAGIGMLVAHRRRVRTLRRRHL